MDQLVGAQSQAKVAKKMQKHPHLRRSPQQTPNQKQKNVFSLSTRKLAESVEGLYSSLALAAGDLWPKKGAPIYWLARSLKELWSRAYQTRPTTSFFAWLTRNNGRDSPNAGRSKRALSIRHYCVVDMRLDWRSCWDSWKLVPMDLEILGLSRRSLLVNPALTVTLILPLRFTVKDCNKHIWITLETEQSDIRHCDFHE